MDRELLIAMFLAFMILLLAAKKTRDREEDDLEKNVTPKVAKQIYREEGGAYYAWSLPMLRRGNVGAAKLALDKNGFALPRCSASAKLAYVLEGGGVAGIVFPEKEEKVVPIRKGDAIALPLGVVTWYFNENDADLVILFLADTSKAHKSGCFNVRNFTDFSRGRGWDFDETNRSGIVKLNHSSSSKMPEPKIEDYNGMAFNCDEAPSDVEIENGGKVVVLNTKNLPLVGELGLRADLVWLEGRAMFSPGFSSGSALEVTYIVRGSGLVQVAGVDGRRVLEKTIKAGDLFIVPQFYVGSKIANAEGMHWFSIIKTPKATNWKGLSPEVLQAAFIVPTDDVDEEFDRVQEEGL